MPTSDTYIDREMFRDGSQRWLWRIVVAGSLWRAGVSASEHASRLTSHRAWSAYLDTLTTDQRREMPSADNLRLVDLDQLDAPESPPEPTVGSGPV